MNDIATYFIEGLEAVFVGALKAKSPLICYYNWRFKICTKNPSKVTKIPSRNF